MRNRSSASRARGLIKRTTQSQPALPRRRQKRSLEVLESRRVLHHAGDDDEPQIGIFASFIKPDDFVDTEYEESLAAGPVASSPLTAIPILHSLPSATAKIYLDFDGHFEPLWGSYTNITTPVFDIDGDATSFSDTELTRITNIWKRVVEDFAPFQVDVTTENPNDFSNGHGLRVSIGGGGGWLGSPAGGVAYIGDFTNSIANTVFVFPDSLGKNEKYMAEAASHESGHAFGLQHQSTFDANGIKLEEYNPGSNGWAPIMGVSYYNDLTTWYNGTSSSGVSNLQDDLAIISNAINGFGYRPDDHADAVGSGTELVLTGNSVSGSGIIETTADVDAFAVSTDAGQITLTVTGAPLGPNLNAILELRDSNGDLVAADNPSNSLGATITSTVPAGNYTLLVKSNGEYARVGQYTISGTVNAGLFVLSHTPAEGSVVTTLPTDFTINFSEAVIAATLPTDILSVNGIVANSFSVIDGDTVVYHFLTSPVSSQGLQQMSLAGGTILTLADSSPLNPFAGYFRYDALPLAVTSTLPANGSIATLPLVSLQVNFNESFDSSSVDPADLIVSTGTVTGVTIDDANTVTFSITGVTGEGTINYSLGAGTITDGFGNPLVAYAGTLTLDYGTTLFPLPLTAVQPLGGGIFDPPVSAAIGVVGDNDAYTINLPAGARLSIVVDPAATLRPTVELLGPGNVPVSSTNATVAGQDAVIQTSAIATAGQYTVRVSGANSTTGAYTVQLVLNAGVEQEQHNGPANSTPATAQNMDAGFVDAGGGIEHAGMLGVTDPDSGYLPQESEPNNTYTSADLASHNFGAPPAGRYQLGLKGTIGSSTDFDWYRLGTMQVGDVITVSMSGTGSSRGTLADSAVDLYRGTAASSTLVSSNDDGGAGLDGLIYRFTVTTNDTYYVRARAHSTGTGTYQVGITLENTGTVPVTGGTVTTETEPNNLISSATNASGSWRAVQFASATNGSITTGDTDVFAYEFHAGDLVSLLAHPTSGSLDATIALLNSAGTVIASEDGTSAGTDSPLYGFIIPTTGTYYVRTSATGGTGDYTTSVLLSANTAPTAPPARGDFYELTLSAGQSATLGVRNLAGGTVTLSLTDSAGNVLQPGSTGSTNLDQVVADYVAPASGLYYAKIDGGFNTPYSLVVTRGGAFDTEANDDSSGDLVALDHVQGAIGHLNANSPTEFGVLQLALNPLLSSVTLAAEFAESPLSEQAPDSLTAHYAGSITVNRQPTYVQFPSGSQINALSIPGMFLPNPTEANYALQLEFLPDVFAYGKISGVTLDLTSALLDAFGSIDFDGPVTTNFPANSVVFTFTGGTFDYDVPGLLTGSQSIAGLSETNQTEALASLEKIDGSLQLVIPVEINTSLIEPTTLVPFTLHLTGQIVASAVLPGPIDPVDWYEVQLDAGQQLTVSTATPGDASGLVPTSTLDPRLQILAPNGSQVAENDNSAGDGKNSSLTYLAPSTGVYRIGVHAVAGEGDYVLHASVGQPDPAPKVLNVAVRGADGTHPWYDIPAGSGDQLKSVPVGRVDQISVTFSTDVQIDATDISLTGLGDRPPYTFADFSYTAGTHTAVWTLSAPLGTDQLSLVLNADGVSPITSQAGDALDGEWNNPASLAQLGSSLFPSGNGTPGGDFVFNWRVSPGDANQDYFVDGADYTSWADHFLQDGGSPTIGDFNTDGFVDGADYVIWADHFAPNLAPPPAPSQIAAAPQQVSTAGSESAVDLAISDIAAAPSLSETELRRLKATPIFRNDADAIAPRARLQQFATLWVSADAVDQSRLGIPAVVRELVQNVRSRISERAAQTTVVDRWMHDLTLAAATSDLGIEDLIGELARGRGRLGRVARS